jgi:hypothetical protein
VIVVQGVLPEFILSACLRYDMAPIPLTFEAQLRLTPATAPVLKDGALIRVNEIDFRIIKAEPLRNGGGATQADMPLSAVAITAFPDSVVAVARRRSAAVIGTNTSFAGLYRSCGAAAALTGDITIGRFACFRGDVPTYQLAKVLQEESAVLIWKAGRVALVRLRDMLAQAPTESLSVTSSEDVQSSFLEADEIPVYFSTGADGKFVMGERSSDGQAIVYAPHKNARELAQMARVLVRRKIITALPSPDIQAGAVVDIRGTPMAVLTAAHYMKNNTDGAGSAQYSRFWLGSLA